MLARGSGVFCVPAGFVGSTQKPLRPKPLPSHTERLRRLGLTRGLHRASVPAWWLCGVFWQATTSFGAAFRLALPSHHAKPSMACFGTAKPRQSLYFHIGARLASYTGKLRKEQKRRIYHKKLKTAYRPAVWLTGHIDITGLP